MSDNTLRRVEQACTDLLDTGEQVTFTAVAARTGLARTTLYQTGEPEQTEQRPHVD